MYRIGLSTCSKVIDEELFRQYREAGIAAAEISTAFDKYDSLDYRAIERNARKYGIELWSYHLPFWPFSEIDPSVASLQKHAISYFSELIKKASDIGIPRFVIHPSGEPIADADRPERMRVATDTLATLAEVCVQNGAILAIEDLPRTCLGNCSAEILSLLRGHDAMRVCFDTNHLLGGEDPAAFIRAVGDKLVTLHVSDYDFVDERHWLPGEGDIDWSGIVEALRDVDYQGVFMYEISPKCPKTILRDRDLVYTDFVRNAKEILSGKKPTVFATRIPGLGPEVF